MTTPRFETERLVLRQYAEGDRNGFVTLNCDPVVRRHMNGPSSPASASRQFDRILSLDAGSKFTAWAVIEKSSDEYIGHAFFTQEFGQSDPELGFLFFRSYWGRGFGTEVARRLVAYAFDEARFLRVVATVDADHQPSIRVLEKAGLKLEATKQDEHGPHHVYALAHEMYCGRDT